MLNGKWPEACSRCQSEEGAGVQSSRQAWNKHYADSIGSAISQTTESGEAPANIRYIDLRLGNLCNLKCRMCNPYASRKWLEDWDKVYPALEKAESDRLDQMSWFTDPQVWEVVRGALANCDQIYFTGGEPLLIDEHQRFLKLCIDDGHASRLTLKYNTNLTHLPAELLDLWRHFKKVRINGSLDGLQGLNEYIRYPSKWPIVLKNIERLEELGLSTSNLILTFHLTVQIYNFLNLTEIFEFTKTMRSFKKLPFLNILDRPDHLNIRNVPETLKAEGIAKLDKWIAENVDFLSRCDSEYVEKIHSLKSYALSANADRASLLEFKAFTQKLDSNRKQSFQKIVPQWSTYL